MSDLKDIAAAFLGVKPDQVKATEVTIGPDTDLNQWKDELMQRYAAWLAKVGKLMGVPAEKLVSDVCWFWCFDDGLTPETAVAEFRKRQTG